MFASGRCVVSCVLLFPGLTMVMSGVSLDVAHVFCVVTHVVPLSATTRVCHQPNPLAPAVTSIHPPHSTQIVKFTEKLED